MNNARLFLYFDLAAPEWLNSLDHHSKDIENKANCPFKGTGLSGQ